MSSPSTPLVLTELTEDGIFILTLNRPKQLNSVNDFVYGEFCAALTFAEKETKVKVVVVTGSEFRAFCAGADLQAGFDPYVGPLKSMKGSYLDPVGKFMSQVIRFNKPLVAAVQGICVGVGATLLPHCDAVYCVPHATFETPFTKIGVCPEFCSSVLFPEILGPTTASEVLFWGRKLSAKEAVHSRLVGEIIDATSREEFLGKVLAKLRPALVFPNSGRSMTLFKQLVRSPERIQFLEATHKKEMDLLDARSAGPDSEAAQGVRFLQSLKKPKL